MVSFRKPRRAGPSDTNAAVSFRPVHPRAQHSPAAVGLGGTNAAARLTVWQATPVDHNGLEDVALIRRAPAVGAATPVGHNGLEDVAFVGEATAVGATTATTPPASHHVDNSPADADTLP